MKNTKRLAGPPFTRPGINPHIRAKMLTLGVILLHEPHQGHLPRAQR